MTQYGRAGAKLTAKQLAKLRAEQSLKNLRAGSNRLVNHLSPEVNEALSSLYSRGGNAFESLAGGVKETVKDIPKVANNIKGANILEALSKNEKLMSGLKATGRAGAKLGYLGDLVGAYGGYKSLTTNTTKKNKAIGGAQLATALAGLLPLAVPGVGEAYAIPLALGGIGSGALELLKDRPSGKPQPKKQQSKQQNTDILLSDITPQEYQQALAEVSSQPQYQQGNYNPLAGYKGLGPQIKNVNNVRLRQLQPNIANKNINKPKDSNSSYDNLLQVLAEQQRAINEAKEPAIQRLSNLIDNYGDLYKQARNQSLWGAGMSGITNNSKYSDIANNYNNINREQDLIKLQDALATAKQGKTDALNTMVGNLAMTKNMGLTPESSLADKDWINAYGNYYGTNVGYAGKKYAADLGYKSDLEKMANAIEIARQNNATELRKSIEANDTRRYVARTNAFANLYNYGGGVSPEMGGLLYNGRIPRGGLVNPLFGKGNNNQPIMINTQTDGFN